MNKLNQKTISLGKKLSYGLGALLLSAFTNLQCVFHSQKVMDLRKISVEELIQNYGSYTAINRNISALDYRAMLLSLKHIGLGVEAIEEIRTHLLTHKTEIENLFKKHHVLPEKFYKHSVMVILKENQDYLSTDEIDFIKDLKKYSLMNEKQILKLQELKGEFSRSRIIFKEGDFIVGSAWIIFLMSIFLEIRRKTRSDKEGLEDFDKSLRSLPAFLSALVILGYYAVISGETLIDKVNDKDDLTSQSIQAPPIRPSGF